MAVLAPGGEINTRSNLLVTGGRPDREIVQQLELFKSKPPAWNQPAREFKVITLRDGPLPGAMPPCETPQQGADYWRRCIATADWYSPDRECFAVLLLNTRARILGHHLVAIGSLDSVFVHAREVFRAAIVAACHSILMGHNHPSGDPTPSAADLRVTRELVSAGELLKMPVIDHLIIGREKHSSLKELGVL